MINAIAIDDELPSLEIIEVFCSKLDSLDLKKTFLKTSEARYYLENNPIDLIFLDINMPNKSGVDFFKELPQETLVVFTTAYVEFAVESYEIGALDYLLKPFSYIRFKIAVDRALEKKNISQNNDVTFIYFKADYGLVKVNLNDIIYVEGQDNYVKIYIENHKSILVRMSIKDIVEKLPKRDFCRIHRSSVVQLKKITSYRNKIVNLGNISLPVGITFENDFIKKITNYI
jgi:DNA-binding LytR/AlgR family response regulator